MITHNAALIISNVWMIGSVNAPSATVRVACWGGAALWFIVYLCALYESRQNHRQDGDHESV